MISRDTIEGPDALHRGPLFGKTIVVLESRMEREMADLVRRQGGAALSAPSMQEIPLPQNQDVRAAVEGLSARRFDTVVFLTGVGARALLQAAEALGRKDEVLSALRQMRVACRGPKPVLVCRQNAIPVAVVAPEPNTSEDLVAALAGATGGLACSRLLLQHYGVANAALKAALEGMGAAVTDVSLYEWGLPKDAAPLEKAIREMAQGRPDAVLFTSQQQVRNLFAVAERLGLSFALRKALQECLVVGAVGPVVTRTLGEFGITPAVVPEHPKMGVLVRALGEYWSGGTGTGE